MDDMQRAADTDTVYGGRGVRGFFVLNFLLINSYTL